MFNCLKNYFNVEKREIYVGFKFVIKRVYREKIVYLKCEVISNSHPNFYLVKVQSNYNNTVYTKTIHKDDFPENFYENMILSYKNLTFI
ncbi:hypothetical protein ACTQ5K_08945 [Niallia sp. Sow4_A1]|uniref:hypothetical protein n=1 Tax=unclassified Niallia TaxID=2837522 RepID=UPI00203D3DF3|nr:hypothetical protein [Niallia sp. MER TA 168]MCM3363757.1 hypothetical protein [Niallia sp. MER TA 168]